MKRQIGCNIYYICYLSYVFQRVNIEKGRGLKPNLKTIELNALWTGKPLSNEKK